MLSGNETHINTLWGWEVQVAQNESLKAVIMTVGREDYNSLRLSKFLSMSPFPLPPIEAG
jgi:hypothetical protein